MPGCSPRARPGNPLTAREWEVLTLIARGRSNKEIGLALKIKVETVKNHIYSIYQKVGLGNRVEAANWLWNRVMG